jgi:hypothetical protein
MIQPSEKTWKESKKFLMTMVATFQWVALMAVVATLMEGAGRDAVLMVMSGCLAFVQIVYIGGQAAVDTFVRGASAVVSVFGASPTKPAPPAPNPEPTPAPPDNTP